MPIAIHAKCAAYLSIVMIAINSQLFIAKSTVGGRSRDMSELVPIISLWMPWANWVSLKWKPIETRTHNRFASLVGKRIGIHCSLKWDDGAVDAARKYLTLDQIITTNRMLKIGGAIICTGLVKEFRKLMDADSPLALIDCGSVERYGLILEDVQTIEAIPCKGRQGIWYQELAVKP